MVGFLGVPELFDSLSTIGLLIIYNMGYGLYIATMYYTSKAPTVLMCEISKSGYVWPGLPGDVVRDGKHKLWNEDRGRVLVVYVKADRVAYTKYALNIIVGAYRLQSREIITFSK